MKYKIEYAVEPVRAVVYCTNSSMIKEWAKKPPRSLSVDR